MSTAKHESPPDHCPWGRIDHREKVAEGIYLYSTGSHGAFWLSKARLAELPPWAAAYQTFAFRTFAGNTAQWYEEDVDWCIPAIVFQADFRRWWASKRATTEQINEAMDCAEVILKNALPIVASARAAATKETVTC